MDQLIFLQDMAVVMAVSAVIIILCQRFHIPVVLGYILAGVLIGPNTLPYPLIHDIGSIHVLSELGIIFLLFSIGLEFNLIRLAKVGLVSLFAATVKILLMIGIGFSIGRAFGWNATDSLFLGAILSISSTTIIAKVLIDMKKIKEQFAQVILGILIIEDLLAIVIIALLSGVVTTGTLNAGEAMAATLRVLAFVAGILFFGFLLVPKLLRYLSKFESSEMLVVTVLGLCFGVSLLAAKFGFSVALGAFLIGAVIAETRQVKEIVRKMEPIRDMFIAIFFVSVGLLISPQVIQQFWFPILILTAATIVGKVFSCTAATFLMGYNKETALKVGLGLAPIGEFSFIIARLGESSGVTSLFLYPIAVSVSVITTLATSILMRSTNGIIGLAYRMTPKPLATALGFYTGWFEKIGESPSERRALIMKGVRFYAVRFSIYAAGGLVLYYGISILQNHFHIFSARVFDLALAAIPVLVLAIFLYIYVWGSIDRAHERIEKMVLGIFDQEKPQEAGKTDAAHKEIVKLMQEEYPWNAKTEDFLLPYQETAANQSIRDLRLRSETGASIVAIYRDDTSIPNPPPETILMPGDVVLLMGDEAQIKTGVKYLYSKIKEAPVKSRSAQEDAPKTLAFETPAGSACLGKTLREIKLRRKTGASVLGIRKEGLSVNNPDPNTVLEAGDVLALFGLPDQLERAVKYLGEKSQ